MSCSGLLFFFIKNIYMKVSAVSKPFQTEAKVNAWQKKKKKEERAFFSLCLACAVRSLPAAVTTATPKQKFTFN